jgi:protease-4
MRDRLAVVPFRGTIRERSVEPYLQLFRALRQRSRVKGVLLDISSGGGESIASMDLYLAIKRLDRVKPVFALIGSVGASGAYLAALGARRLFAYPESAVGSIGVILPHLAVEGLLQKLGISVELLHAGEHKDAFQGIRPLSEVERAKMQAVLDEGYEEFVALVARERHRSVDEIRPLATGEIWTGRRALALGLLDQLADREEALDALSAATGVPVGRTVRVGPPRPFLDRLLNGRGPGLGGGGLLGRLREAVEESVLDWPGGGLWK